MSDYLIPIPKSHKEHGKFRRKQMKKEVIKQKHKDFRFFDGPPPARPTNSIPSEILQRRVQ